MKLKSIIKPGIIGAGIVAFAAGAGEAIAESFYNENPKNILVNVEKGDTLGKIIWKLDRKYGNDDPNDAVRNLDDYLISGDIAYANCNNKIRNKNIIEAERKLLIKGRALDDIDPDYGKSNISENKDYGREIADKDIQIKTESKTRPTRHKERSLISDISRVRDYTNKEDNRTGKFVLSGEIGYSIFGENIGEGISIDLNAGYQVPGLIFSVGGRATQIPKTEYYNYRRSFFGFLNEAELDEEYLTATELYAQLMFGNNTFRIGGGCGVKNIGNIEAGASYGYWEGEGGISRDYDTYMGGFGAFKFMFPIDKNLSVSISARYGKYNTKDGLKLDETSISAGLEARF